jgi:hypothetical protein
MAMIKLKKCTENGVALNDGFRDLLVNPDSICFYGYAYQQPSPEPTVTEIQFTGGQVRWVLDSPDAITIMIKHSV